jgi:hypothetical protein
VSCATGRLCLGIHALLSGQQVQVASSIGSPSVWRVLCFQAGCNSTFLQGLKVLSLLPNCRHHVGRGVAVAAVQEGPRLGLLLLCAVHADCHCTQHWHWSGKGCFCNHLHQAGLHGIKTGSTYWEAINSRPASAAPWLQAEQSIHCRSLFTSRCNTADAILMVFLVDAVLFYNNTLAAKR